MGLLKQLRQYGVDVERDGNGLKFTTYISMDRKIDITDAMIRELSDNEIFELHAQLEDERLESRWPDRSEREGA